MDTPATVNIDMGVRTNVNFFSKRETSVYTVVLKKKKVEIFLKQSVLLPHVLSKPQCFQPFSVVPPAVSFSRISSNPQSYIAKKINVYFYIFSPVPLRGGPFLLLPRHPALLRPQALRRRREDEDARPHRAGHEGGEGPGGWASGFNGIVSRAL